LARLDHLQRKADGDCGIEGVAAFFEDTHARRGAEPVRGGNDTESADDFRPCRKRRLAGIGPITQSEISQRQVL
jgi:hypothetical protein